MADTYRVSCINKRQHQNPHERIERIGGVLDNGTAWTLPEDSAIAGIRSGKWDFWVSVGGKSVWIVVAEHEGRPYLKTEPDGYAPNNLLSLPECP
jgi:hypothetical protein